MPEWTFGRLGAQVSVHHEPLLLDQFDVNHDVGKPASEGGMGDVLRRDPAAHPALAGNLASRCSTSYGSTGRSA